jgi:hypothetical protein
VDDATVMIENINTHLEMAEKAGGEVDLRIVGVIVHANMRAEGCGVTIVTGMRARIFFPTNIKGIRDLSIVSTELVGIIPLT